MDRERKKSPKSPDALRIYIEAELALAGLEARYSSSVPQPDHSMEELAEFAAEESADAKEQQDAGNERHYS